MLHPGCKVEYFRKLGWPQVWIDVALRILRGEWIESYKGKYDTVEEEDGEAEAVSRRYHPHSALANLFLGRCS